MLTASATLAGYLGETAPGRQAGDHEVGADEG
jgi:hypothetical protein